MAHRSTEGSPPFCEATEKGAGNDGFVLGRPDKAFTPQDYTNGSNSTESASLPVWSQDPKVNLVCVHLILKTLKDQEDNKDSSTTNPQHMIMMGLVQTLLGRLPKLPDGRDPGPEEISELVQQDEKVKFLILGMSQAMSGKKTASGGTATNTTASNTDSQSSGNSRSNSEDSPSSESDEEMKKRPAKRVKPSVETATASNTDSHSSERDSSNSEDCPSSESDEEMKKRPAKRPKQELQQSTALGQESLTSSSDEETKMPAKRQHPETEQMLQLSGKAASTSTSAATSGSSVSSAAAELSPKPESSGCSTDSTSPQELVAALAQHLDILHQRGQVSSSIPMFLRSVAQAQISWEKADNDDSSNSSTKAMRSVKHTGEIASRDEYYHELTAECLAGLKPPMPKWITFSFCSLTQPLEGIAQTRQVGADSDISVSMCPSIDGSSPAPSDYDYESSTGESNGDTRTVRFATDTDDPTDSLQST